MSPSADKYELSKIQLTILHTFKMSPFALGDENMIILVQHFYLPNEEACRKKLKIRFGKVDFTQKPN